MVFVPEVFSAPIATALESPVSRPIVVAYPVSVNPALPDLVREYRLVPVPAKYKPEIDTDALRTGFTTLAAVNAATSPVDGAGPAPPFQLVAALKSVLPEVFLQTCCASMGVPSGGGGGSAGGWGVGSGVGSGIGSVTGSGVGEGSCAATNFGAAATRKAARTNVKRVRREGEEIFKVA